MPTITIQTRVRESMRTGRYITDRKVFNTDTDVNPFAHYIEYKAARFRGSPSAAYGGTFQWEYLNAEGRRMREGIKRFFPRNPKYRGLSKVGVYFKWLMKDGEEFEKLTLGAADWIREEGHEVKVEVIERPIKDYRRTGRWNGTDVYTWVQIGVNRYVKLTLTGGVHDKSEIMESYLDFYDNFTTLPKSEWIS